MLSRNYFLLAFDIGLDLADDYFEHTLLLPQLVDFLF